MTTRRQVTELTEADLRLHPVWMFGLELEDGSEDEETAVAPAYDYEDNIFSGNHFVRAQFVLASGRALPGFFTPITEHEEVLTSTHPVAITNGGQVPFYHGVLKPSCAELDSFYEL